MSLYNRYFVILAALFFLTTTVLAAYGQDQLDAYLTAYVIEYLITTLLFVYFDRTARRLLDGMGYVLFAGFLAIVVMKVIEILRSS